MTFKLFYSIYISLIEKCYNDTAMSKVISFIKQHWRWFIILGGIILIILVIFLLISQSQESNNEIPPESNSSNQSDDSSDNKKIDDWQLDIKSSTPSAEASDSLTSTTAESLGFSTGGAKDINNFRQNIENGYLPIPTDISHEGLFYEYFFETDFEESDTCEQLFCPTYETAVSTDPFSNKNEHFLAVGLNSDLEIDSFQRKKLNLVLALDISGSMSSPFDKYYYNGRLLADQETRPDTRSKLEIASHALINLLNHLDDDDRLGIILFDHNVYQAKPIRLVEETDINALKGHLRELQAGGGTNMEAGYRQASQLLTEFSDAEQDEYENRIIFLTDAMPNIGALNNNDLANLIADNARQNIYTSFIGLGIDANSQLIETLSRTKGANHYFIHDSNEFIRRLNEGFDYMVTPLVFDLQLNLKSPGYKIKAVYGSPEADLSTGQLMKINTLFPSLRINDQTRGGLVLLHLEKISDSTLIDLDISYKDRLGKHFKHSTKIDFPDSKTPYYSNLGIRKGIALARYVNVLRDWLAYQNNAQKYNIELHKHCKKPIDYRQCGIPVVSNADLGIWERTSKTLILDKKYQTIMLQLQNYLNTELSLIGDDQLQIEIDLLGKIIKATQH